MLQASLDGRAPRLAELSLAGLARGLAELSLAGGAGLRAGSRS